MRRARLRAIAGCLIANREAIVRLTPTVVGVARPIRMTLAAVVTTVVGLALCATPAAAKSGAPSAGPHKNCVVSLTGGGVSTTTCFATFTEAMRRATNGLFTDAPATAADAVKDSRLDAKINAANNVNVAANASLAAAGRVVPTSVLVAVEYDLADYDNGYGSLMLNMRQECTRPIDDVDDYYLFPTSWYDSISSFRNYAHCWTSHHYNANFDQPHTDFEDDQPEMSVVDGIDYDNNSRALRFS